MQSSLAPTSGGLRRLARAGAGGCLVLALGACDDAAPAGAAPLASVAARGRTLTVADAAQADFFAVDVSITAHSEAAPPAPAITRTAAYRMERERGADGVWKTTYSFEPVAVSGLGPERRGTRQDIARVETDDSRRYLRAYDRSGQEVSLEPPGRSKAIDLARERGLELPADRLASMPKLPGSPPARGGKAFDSAAWLAANLQTRAHRAHEHARIQRQFGQARAQVRGLNRYVLDREGREVEVLVDPATDAVAEQTVREKGRVRHQVTFGYSKFSDDVLLRSSARAVLSPADERAKPTVVEYRLSNLRLEHRGTN